MVMETPSPQCVGLEFVRQYYTVLNKAPLHLHRFYSNDSLFMHGGPNTVTDPTVGQANIHKKILNLNFKDCHAKIRMVDAHATLGKGVVIQVTGELSNNGLPMRRFMQTFVLAPQTAKKFYVHNDIFRYQDEVFSDDDGQENSDVEDDMENNTSNLAETSFGTTNPTVNGTSHLSHSRLQQPPEPEMTTAGPVAPSAPVTSIHMQNSTQLPPSPVSAPVAPVAPSTPPIAQPSVPADSPPPAPVQNTHSAPPVQQEPVEVPVPENDDWRASGASDEESGWNEGPVEDWADALEEAPPTPPKKVHTPKKTSPPAVQEQTPPPNPPAPSNEPRTFANLFKTSSLISQATPPIQSFPTSVPPPSEPSPMSQNSFYPAMNRSEASSGRSPGGSSAMSQSQQGPMSSNPKVIRSSYDDDKRRTAVPDTQQVFVGNLPHSIGEDKLRAEFEQYGKILEIRINIGKGKTGHHVPNFGFVAFEDEESVHRCLKARPIYFNENRINVEEKKARSRMDSMGGGPVMGMGGRPSSGGGRGMGGAMRGGQGGRGSRSSFGPRDSSRGAVGGGSRGGGGYISRR